MLKILLFLWLPLSVGIIQGFGASIGMGMTAQHLVLMLYPLCSLAYAGVTGRWFNNKYVVFYLLFMIAHGVVFYKELSVFVKLAASIGVVQWAYLVATQVRFEEFVKINALSAGIFLLLTVVFIFVFPQYSYQYFWGEEVVTSFYTHKNTYGRFLIIGSMFALIAFLMTKNKIYLLVVGLAILMSVFSSSRTAMGLIAISILIAALVYMRLLGVRLYVFGVAVIVTCFAMGVASGHIYFHTLGSALDGIVIFGHEIWLTGRATVWNSLMYQLTYDDKWWFGYGLDTFFNDLSLVYQALGAIGLGVFIASDPHNGYLELVLCYGLFGVMVWLGLCLVVVRVFLKSRPSKVETIFFIVTLNAYLIANMSESFITKTTNTFSFLFFYLIFFSASRSKENIDCDKSF